MQKRSELLAISNQYKDTLDDFINISDDGLNTEAPAKMRQIYRSSNDISSSKEEDKDFNDERNILRNRS